MKNLYFKTADGTIKLEKNKNAYTQIRQLRQSQTSQNRSFRQTITILTAGQLVR